MFPELKTKTLNICSILYSINKTWGVEYRLIIIKNRGGKSKMAEKVAKIGVKKQEGYLYFVDKKGNVARAKMSRGGRKKGKAKVEVVAKAGVKKKSGYLYFIDKHGDVSAAKMARGGRKKKRR